MDNEDRGILVRRYVKMKEHLWTLVSSAKLRALMRNTEDEFHKKLERSPRMDGGRGGIRAACILDDFSYHTLKDELELLPVLPDRWFEPLRSGVDMFLVEAFWRGSGGTWRGIAYDYNVKERQLLKRIVSWCRENHIPTVFWNKEDPSHFDEFIDIALEFDHIFTTDADCLPHYERRGRKAEVLQFAAQPSIHNPIEIFPTREDRVCFAGSYIRLYPERMRDFDAIADSLQEVGLDIYDRNLERKDGRLQFPERFRPSIKGVLKGEEILMAYKGYRYGLNMNSIKGSPTMFARRVFELMACNTVVLSNRSEGLLRQFGDLVVCSDDPEEILSRVMGLRSDERSYRTLRLRALREVMSRHTYRDRVDLINSTVLNERPGPRFREVDCIASVSNEGEKDAVERSYHAQGPISKELILLPNMDIKALEGVWPMAIERMHLLTFLDPLDHYGPHYLEDMVLSFLYSGAAAVTKLSHYQGSLDLMDDGHQYRWVETTLPSALVIDPSKVTPSDAMRMLAGDVPAGTRCLCLDEFNFVRSPSPSSPHSIIDV
jgi:glycosyltransferase involved in cell wall biosynthesis